MLAVDTNVVVRYLTRDEPAQAARARALIDGTAVFISSTVLLESEWVLRDVYRYSAAKVGEALRAFCQLRTIVVEDSRSAMQALNWMEQGLDFADALHLAKALDCEAFISFDRALARAANRLAGVTVRAP